MEVKSIDSQFRIKYNKYTHNKGAHMYNNIHYEIVKADPDIMMGYFREYTQGLTSLEYDQWFEQQWQLTAVKSVEELINE
jgi:hypothetical protein